ncbi:MAG: S9 family peptidase [Terriglobales bacterium]
MRLTACLVSLGLVGAALAQTPARRPLRLDDIYQLQNVRDPEVSPQGQWVAYTVSSIDKKADKSVSHLWMAAWNGATDLELTYGDQEASAPRWSPDGRYLSFLSSRPGPAKGTQVWVLDRRGGEARQLTNVQGEISGYGWSPDSRRLLLALQIKKETPNAQPHGAEKPEPIVIDRYHFKEDRIGYLTGQRRHLYLYDIASRQLARLTNSSDVDEGEAAWSPDGSEIAYVSNHQPEPDRTDATDIFVVAAQPGSTPRQLTDFAGPDGGHLSWSPDGRWIAFLRGSPAKYSAYNENRLAIVAADGSAPARLLTESLDRGVSAPEFAADGRSILLTVEDDRSQYLASISVKSGAVERLTSGRQVVMAPSSRAGHMAVLVANDDAAPEVYALDGGRLRALTHHNDGLFAQLHLGRVREFEFTSTEGTDVHGLLTLPPDYVEGTKVPTLLRIHGGPDGQDAHEFSFEHQWFAAHGYAVIAINYRGSSGRGWDYQRSIFADWGDKEVKDLLAGVDHVIAMGVADPNRLGIGGWSYGAILTDYTIASDGRFRAAIAGAGSANQAAMYGVDEYASQYDLEIGPPWKSAALWVKISYPFYHADRIHTPTLFMGGDKDFNVPLIGGEQMYQALRTLRVPTELVIYPGQFHGFTRPSFIVDRYRRYLAWYDKYVKGAAAPAAAVAAVR